MPQLCELMGDDDEAARAQGSTGNVRCDPEGWLGRRLVRTCLRCLQPQSRFQECREGQIYIEPQGFCVLAGVGVKEGLAEKALNSVKERLDTKYGVMILQPAYTEYHLELGEVSSYPPG